MAGREERGSRPQPRITFFQPRVSQVLVLFSLFGGNESALRRFLPKSHLAKVIIRDNNSVQRVEAIKLRHIEDNKRKVSGLCDQMKKKFLHEQQRKMGRWKKEYSRYQRMLEQIDTHVPRKPTFSRLIAETSKSSELEWKAILKQSKIKPPVHAL